MSPTVWIVVAIVIVVVLGVVIWMAYTRRRRSAALHDRFGPEYDRAVDEYGGHGRAERELEARAQRVRKLHLQTLTPDQRGRYTGEWHEVQAQFVDDPEAAIGRADRLVADVMQERGYPMTDFDQRAADISVGHPREVGHYRAAHSIANRVSSDSVSTEELRQAMVHYRSLFEELVEGRQPALMEVRS